MPTKTSLRNLSPFYGGVASHIRIPPYFPTDRDPETARLTADGMRRTFTSLMDQRGARLAHSLAYDVDQFVSLREVMESDFSSLTGTEAYAASEKTPAELQELLVLTLRRERLFAEALQDLKLREIHALAFPGDQADPVEPETVGDDPILAAIREHKAAYAAWLPHLRATSETALSDPGYPDLEAAAEAPGEREHTAYKALSDVLPTTLDGLVALAGYLPGAVLRNSCTNADNDAMRALGAMCGAVKELVKPSRMESVGNALAASNRAVREPSGADPIHAAIEASRVAQSAMQRWNDTFRLGPLTEADFAEEGRLNKVQACAYESVIATVIAYLDHLDDDPDAEDDGTAEPVMAALVADGIQIRWAGFEGGAA